MGNMVPISFVVWIALVEATIIWIIIDSQRPNKEIRRKIREFADEYDMPEHAARNKILTIFFKAYEAGLKEKMKAAHEKAYPSFEEWKAEQDAKFEKELEELEKQNT